MGGLARRAALFRNVREARENTFVVDAGNLFGHRREAERRQTEFLLDYTEQLGYEVFGVGPNDLNYGLDFLREAEREHGFLFTNANLAIGDGDPDDLFPPYVIREIAGLTVGYVSVISPRYPIVTMTASADNFTAQSPRDALEGVLPTLREEADLIILLAQMPSAEIRQMLMDMGPGTGIDICVEGRDPRQYRRVNRVNGDIVLVSANHEGRYVGQLDMVVTPDGQIEDAAVTIHALDKNNPEIEEIREDVDAFDARNKEQIGKVESFDHPRVHGSGDEKFLGVHNCARCHTDAARSYMQSAHAQAFQSLVAKGQDKNPECVSCHVVGFEWKNGYDQVADPDVPGREALKNVQCEACHGYGTEHARDGTWGAVARESCVTCHDQENSPNFDYETYWAKIAH